MKKNKSKNDAYKFEKDLSEINDTLEKPKKVLIP
jgi:hypothetical protein